MTDGDVRIAPRGELPARPTATSCRPARSSSRDGAVAFDRAADTEGFSAGCEQFDSDITDGRHPRAAIGIGDSTLWVLACDGRRSRRRRRAHDRRARRGDARPRLPRAMNLDGGGSTTLVHRRHLLNRPYSEQDQAAPASRPIVTALVL